MIQHIGVGDVDGEVDESAGDGAREVVVATAVSDSNSSTSKAGSVTKSPVIWSKVTVSPSAPDTRTVCEPVAGTDPTTEPLVNTVGAVVTPSISMAGGARAAVVAGDDSDAAAFGAIAEDLAERSGLRATVIEGDRDQRAGELEARHRTGAARTHDTLDGGRVDVDARTRSSRQRRSR